MSVGVSTSLGTFMLPRVVCLYVCSIIRSFVRSFDRSFVCLFV